MSESQQGPVSLTQDSDASMDAPAPVVMAQQHVMPPAAQHVPPAVGTAAPPPASPLAAQGAAAAATAAAAHGSNSVHENEVERQAKALDAQSQVRCRCRPATVPLLGANSARGAPSFSRAQAAHRTAGRCVSSDPMH